MTPVFAAPMVIRVLTVTHTQPNKTKKAEKELRQPTNDVFTLGDDKNVIHMAGKIWQSISVQNYCGCIWQRQDKIGRSTIWRYCCTGQGARTDTT